MKEMAKYQSSSVRKATGSHYTPTRLARFVAAQIVGQLDSIDTSLSLEILDPAVGDGELLISLRNKLLLKGHSSIHVTGFDTNSRAVDETRQRIGSDSPSTIKESDFTTFALEHRNAGTLFPLPKFDLIIANPPYVRTQVLGADQSKELAASFGLSGRIDLYHVFLSGIASVLKTNGIAGVIVSNRFMTTRGGTDIRNLLRKEFEILHVFDLGDTKIFEAAVLPAVLILRKKGEANQQENPRFTTIYSTSGNVPDHSVENIFEGLHLDGTIETATNEQFIVKQGILNLDSKNEQVWSLSNDASDSWLQTVADNTFMEFGEIGKIRVGVKTTSDKVFIRSDWNDLPLEERPELLKPIITHHNATRFRSVENGRYIVYPHEMHEGRRRAVDLALFPRTEKYFLKHRQILEGRSYVAAGGRNWYEIWVPQNPDSWAKPKIVFRDISSSPMFWMDLTGAVVNGDCYWLKADEDSSEELLWLALAVGNSTFIEEFYDHSFNNKLYSGRRRFMSQYVEKFPLPNPDNPISKQILLLTKSLYDNLETGDNNQLEKRIDSLVWQAFGFNIEELGR